MAQNEDDPFTFSTNGIDPDRINDVRIQFLFGPQDGLVHEVRDVQEPDDEISERVIFETKTRRQIYDIYSDECRVLFYKFVRYELVLNI